MRGALMKLKRIILLLISIALTCGAIAPFQANQRVVFLGDSITHYCRWWPYIWSYYITRFPERNVMCINAGISGDTAAGALGRLQKDVLNRKPDRVCVMFGMNDIGRSSYKEKPLPEDLHARKVSLEVYRKSMNELLARLKSANLPVTVITPSPYDQGMVSPSASAVLPGCNDGLARAASIVKELASDYQCSVVDFYRPMTDLLEKIQAKNPGATLIGPDRIHPRSLGSWVMAWLFLKAQGVPGTVSVVRADFSSGTVLETRNCSAQVQAASDKEIVVCYQPKVLPLPAAGSYQQANELIPLSEDLNREIICVQGLPAGSYHLLLNGQSAGDCTADQFSDGVNFSTFQNNPNQKKAMDVFNRLYDYVKLQRSFQDITFLNTRILKPRGIDPDNIAAGLDYFRNRYDVVTLGDRIRTASYLNWRGKEDQLEARLDKMLDKIYKQCSPDPVEIRIVRDK